MIPTRKLTPVLPVLVPSLCIGLGLISWSTSGDRITFAPSDEASVTKSFITEWELELDDFSMIVGGQDVGAMMGTPEMTIATTGEVVFIDTYGGVDDGRPVKLTRSFETLGADTDVSFTMAGQSEDQNSESTSPLEGVTVVFDWDEEEGEYTASFAEDSGGDDEWLEGLREDADLRALLPSGEVEEGDSWEFEPILLEALVMPGGNLSWENEETADADMEQFEEMFSDLAEDAMALGEELMAGTGTATYNGTREVDGRKVAVIALEIEIGSSADLSEILANIAEKAMEQEDAPEGAEVDIQGADISLDVEAEGELLWDIETGTIFGLSVSGDLDISLDISVFMSMQGQEMDMELSAALSGPFSTDISTTR